VSFILSLVVQAMYLTIIFCCLVPFALIGISAYLTPVYSAVFALAYREGRQKLAV
jgi:predicted membrane chloride channel (bestrophin family)